MVNHEILGCPGILSLNQANDSWEHSAWYFMGIEFWMDVNRLNGDAVPVVDMHFI